MLYVFGSGEEARHRIGNQDGLVGDLRLAHVVDALFEDADDGERNAIDLKRLTNRGTELPKRSLANGSVTTAQLVCVSVVDLVEKPAVGHEQVADVAVVRAHAEHQRVLHQRRRQN